MKEEASSESAHKEVMGKTANQTSGDNYFDTSDPKRYDDGSTSEDEPVTLCIAAECIVDEDSAIVLCADWRAQTTTQGGPLIGTEDTYKIRDIGGMSVLLSGRPSDAHELITACIPAIQKFDSESNNTESSDIAIATFQRELREAAGKRKTEVVEEYIQSSLGMSYAEFRQTRTENFTEFHHHVWESVTRLDLGADLIFCGFCGGTPVIIRLDRFGKSPWETNYTAIGEGAEIARAMLCLQQWSEYGSVGALGTVRPVPLDHCVFRLYEAKTAAHIANPSSVGEATAFRIIVNGKGKFGLDSNMQASLREVFIEKHVVPELKSFRFPEGGFKKGPRKSQLRPFKELLTEPAKLFSGPF